MFSFYFIMFIFMHALLLWTQYIISHIMGQILVQSHRVIFTEAYKGV